MRIWLDDQRPAPMYDRWTGEPIPWDLITDDSDLVIKLITEGKVTYIDFDHDLGYGRKPGSFIAKLIERLAFENKIKPIDYAIHSGNPIGAAEIDAAMKNAWKYWTQRS